MREITVGDWCIHNSWEKAWWGTCQNTFEEQVKQEEYARLMKLNQFSVPGHWFDMRGKSVIDIGGGPCSLLLRCTNLGYAVVVDPCDYPQWVYTRYTDAGIIMHKNLAEYEQLSYIYDEAWIYNCLQHTQNPGRIIEIVKCLAGKVRVCEYCNIGVCPGHPQNLTKEELDTLFDRQGLIKQSTGLVSGEVYYGVFNCE